MSNVKISQLPEYTGNTTGVYLVMNNSGETATYKVKKETLSAGTSGTSGTSGSSITTSGTNNTLTKFTSATTVGNATNLTDDGTTFRVNENTIITGSLNISGSGVFLTGNTPITNTGTVNNVLISTTVVRVQSNSNNRTGSLSNDNIKFETNTGSLNTAILNRTSLTFSDDNGTVTLTKKSGSLLEMSNSLTITGSLITSGSAHTLIGGVSISGSVQGNVFPLSISSNTASLNLDNGNYFTLQLVSGSATHLNPSNIKPGQTVSVFVNTIGSATMTFPSSIKQINGSPYVPTTTTGIDILTLVSKDTSNLYLLNAKNFV